MNLWDSSALAYDRYERRWRTYAKAAGLILDRLSLRKDAVVLDLACGTGASTLEVAKRVTYGRVVGIDSSATMLRFARRNAVSAGFDNIEFYRCDVHTLRRTVFGRFDAAICNAAFWQFVRPLNVLQQLRALLNPDGYFGCTLGPPPAAGDQPYREALQSKREELLRRHGIEIMPSTRRKIWDYRILCKRANFEVERDEVLTVPSSLAETLAWYRIPEFTARGGGIGIPNAPQSLAYRILRELLTSLNRRFPQCFRYVSWRVITARGRLDPK